MTAGPVGSCKRGQDPQKSSLYPEYIKMLNKMTISEAWHIH
jgi:hypothetical protein